MIPRLPPLLLALIGSASIYGIKYAIDRFEPKAIGSGQDFEKVLNYRKNIKRVGMTVGISSILIAGYLLSDLNKREKEKNEFYQDQYATREIQLTREKLNFDKQRREKEALTGQQLKEEVMTMESLLK